MPSSEPGERRKIDAAVKVRGPAGDEEVYVAVGEKRRAEPGLAGLAAARPEPDPEELAEARAYVQSLADHGQLAFDPAAPPPAATHQLEEDAEGRKHLKRRGFAAIAQPPE